MRAAKQGGRGWALTETFEYRCHDHGTIESIDRRDIADAAPPRLCPTCGAELIVTHNGNDDSHAQRS